MVNSLVLDESLSIPSIIENFSNINNNPYQSIVNCAALYSSYMYAKHLGLPTYSMPPSIITLEQSYFDFSEAFIIIISQSGKSLDLIECEKKSRSMEAKTIIITNNDQSPIINDTNYFFNMFAGEEKSVAATKIFVQTLLVLIKLIFTCQGKNEINDDIKLLGETLINDSYNQWSENIVDNTINTGFILGKGVGFAISNEISLKFKELCQEMIEPFGSAEVMHGPKSLTQNLFKFFILDMNDKSGLTVQKDSSEILNYTKLVYNISSNKKLRTDCLYPHNKNSELASVVLMSKFYPWIMRYTMKMGLSHDQPRYLTKVTQTF